MDLYVNDAFGSAHRAHASTEGVAHVLPAYAGLLLLEDELDHLGRLLGDVERPFALVAGGAKVKDKLGVLEHLGGRADIVLVGGKMAEELREENPLDVRGRASGRRRRGVRVRRRGRDARSWRTTPCLTAGSVSTSARRQASASRDCSGRRRRSSGTARWASSNGRASPTGQRRSRSLLPMPTRTPSSAAATRFRAVNELGVADRISWISTGGGASLELLEGKELPGVAAIPDAA